MPVFDPSDDSEQLDCLPGIDEGTQCGGLILKKPKQNSLFTDDKSEVVTEHKFKVPDVPPPKVTKSLLGLDVLAAKKRKLDSEKREQQRESEKERNYRRHESPAPDTPSFPSEKSRDFRSEQSSKDHRRGLASSSAKHRDHDSRGNRKSRGSSDKDETRRSQKSGHDERDPYASPWESNSGADTPVYHSRSRDDGGSSSGRHRGSSR